MLPLGWTELPADWRKRTDDEKYWRRWHHERAAAINCIYDEYAADARMAFFRSLKLIKGKWAGQTFDPLPHVEQQVIRPFFGYKQPGTQAPKQREGLDPLGRRQFRRLDHWVAKKNTKALALDTPIPTPTGWSDMGSLTVGDTVLGPDGAPCRVTAVSNVFVNHDCYRVGFEDGTTIVADAGHLWQTHARRPRNAGVAIRTTAEIAGSMASWNGNNHRIPVASSLQLPAADLSLDPYILGIWLGDGATAGSRISTDDPEVLQSCRAAGFVIGSNDGRCTHYIKGLLPVLRKLGLVGFKHIPIAYLRSSRAQRIALLQGLMDSDGTVAVKGACTFTTTSPELRDGVQELICTLGWKPRTSEFRAKIYGRDCGPGWLTQFWPDEPVFRLGRKSAKQHDGEREYGRLRSASRYVTTCEPTATVPVRCIAVDSPDHLYLAGRSFIATHNTTTAAGLAAESMFLEAEPGYEGYCCAADREQAGLIYQTLAPMVSQSREYAALSKRVDSLKRIVIPSLNGFIQVNSSEAYTKHGSQQFCVIADEIHAWENREYWDVMTQGAFAAREEWMLFVLSTAGFSMDGIGYEEYEYARQVRDGAIDDPRLLPVIHGTTPDEDWTDEDVWYKANPALGFVLSIEDMRDEFAKARALPTNEQAFRVLRLNTWMANATRWLPYDAWQACMGEAKSLYGRHHFGGLDLSSTTDLTAYVRVGFDDDGFLDVHGHYWLPAKGIEDRERLDRAPYREWARQGWMTLTEGNRVDYKSIREKIGRCSDEDGSPVDIGYDPWNAVQLCEVDLVEDGFETIPIRQTYSGLNASTKELSRLVGAGKLRTSADPVMAWASDNVVITTDSAGYIKPDKSKSAKRIDPIVGLVMALDRASRFARQPDGPLILDIEL